uniref:Cytoskeleton-associated protein 5 n=1 Tax=Cacopsylla melanoneura TaxID=428564 RepID=A0A8D8RRZ2_9HEMI
MSNIKRVSLTTIESNHEKIKTKRKGSFRISIPLVEEPASREYSHFNYETLYKSALDKKRQKKDTNGALQNGGGLTNGGGLEFDEDGLGGDEDELVKMAKKFEQKYGGTVKKDKYSELGAGYDDEDSFIDNTDAYNDELSEDLLPKHGGYYLNRGSLVLERIPEEVIENEEELCARKIKRTIRVIQSSDEEEGGEEEESSEAEESGRDEDDEDDSEEDEDEEEDRSYHDEDEGEEEEAVGINPRGLPVAPTLLRKSPTPDIQNKSQIADSEHTLDRTRDSDLDSSIDPLGRLRAPQPRPISGPYSLDMHLIESLETETPASSVGNRVRLNEFDLTYLKEPVPLPSSVLPNGNSGAGGARTLNSSNSILNNSSGYPGNNINVYNTIEQISSKDSDVALKAMQSVEHLILTEKWSQLVPHADWLVRNMVDQLATLRQSEQLDLVNCYRAVFSLCMKLYNVPPLCEKVNEDALHHILKELLMLLSEKKSAKWETTLNMFLKVMNSLALRILERSDHTAAVCATFRVLFDGIKLSIDRPSKQVVHFIELAWKCMWKLIKFFPEWDSSLDYVRILAEAHTFLQTFPSSWWRNQPINTPLRTVKTVIHSMARNRHSDLVQYLNQVPGVTEDCELYYYVHKMQQQFKSDEPSSRPSGQTMSLSRPNESMESNGDMGGNASANMRVTKANADALTEIFKKIGNKDDTHEGLRLLYKWKQEHPEQPLDLTQYSQVFQDYIKRGLKNIELEIRCEQSNKENKRDTDNNLVVLGNDRTSVPSSPASAVSNQSSEPEDAGSTTASYYSKRLKDLQMMAGLVQDGAGSGGGGVTTPRKPKIETEISDLEQLQNISPQRYIKVTSPENFSSVESLRMRLEKIKQPSNS